MSDVKWIKIVTDIFDDEKILLIESMPDADSTIVIWFKLLCLAGKQNNSGVFMLNDKIAYTDEMFAAIFRRPVNTVRYALKTFEDFGMVEIIDGAVTIPNWEKHQNIDGLKKIREDGRKRTAAFRERQKQKLLSEPEETPESVTEPLESNEDSVNKPKCNALHNVTVTECNDTEEEEEEEKEYKNKKNIYKEITQSVIQYLNDKTGSRYNKTSKTNIALVAARLKENPDLTVDDFRQVVDRMTEAWLTDPKMSQYLRPSTLFGSKFDNYLNAPKARTSGSGNQEHSFDLDEFLKLAENRKFD